MEDFSFVFYSAPSGKGSNTAIFSLTTFLLAASPCRVVRTKKKTKCISTQKTLKISKKLSPKTSDTVDGLSQHNFPDFWDRGSRYIAVDPFLHPHDRTRLLIDGSSLYNRRGTSFTTEKTDVFNLWEAPNRHLVLYVRNHMRSNTTLAALSCTLPLRAQCALNGADSLQLNLRRLQVTRVGPAFPLIYPPVGSIIPFIELSTSTPVNCAFVDLYLVLGKGFSALAHNAILLR